ncbi:MAG: family 20 glycosylhydrolase [candidate division KSB1 bacterium]|nr:family 20 glycosylhydrolase [candidate division KSB1 bacterium]
MKRTRLALEQWLTAILILLFTGSTCRTANENKDMIPLIPKPNTFELTSERFILSEKTQILITESTKELGHYLAEQLSRFTGIRIVAEASPDSSWDNCIALKIGGLRHETNAEAYSINVTSDQIEIRALENQGLFRGIQTLLQLAQVPEKETSARAQIEIFGCRIEDKPRFKWRGLHLDCCRHFMTKDFVKRYIDILAHFKFNIFHWHLTEDQGWRIEIKKYPKLTEVGAWRKEAEGTIYGGYYTQEEVKEIVDYARSRYVTIVPEIEMPGHCLASLAAYPENSCTGGPFEVGNVWGVMKDVYCAGRDSTFHFLENILHEVIALFPGDYIHIGGDEVPKDRWRQCPRCQQRIKAEGLTDEQELQSYFIKRISAYLTSKGRKVIGWDEILEGGLAPVATVQSWRGFEGAIEAARQGHGAIVSPAAFTYLSIDAEDLDIRTVYSFEPVPKELTIQEAAHIIGGEACMWTEQAPQETIDGKLFPRLLALAEVLWSDNKNKNYEHFDVRLQHYYNNLMALGIQYGPATKALTAAVSFDHVKNEFTVSITPGQSDLEIHMTTDGSEPNANSRLYDSPVKLNRTGVLKFAAFKNQNMVGRTRVLSFVFHQALNAKVILAEPYSEKYTAGGVSALTNGVRGTDNHHDGLWQGYEGIDFEGVVDLGEEKEVSHLAAGFLQDATSWIFMPEEVEFAVSKDGDQFKCVGIVPNDTPQRASDRIIKDFSVAFDRQLARYICVKAKNIGTCPEWHPGAGGKAWIFVDEIMVE